MISIDIFILYLVVFSLGAIFGLLCGQRSVWRYLRKKGEVIINNWKYTGEERK